MFTMYTRKDISMTMENIKIYMEEQLNRPGAADS